MITFLMCAQKLSLLLSATKHFHMLTQTYYSCLFYPHPFSMGHTNLPSEVFQTLEGIASLEKRFGKAEIGGLLRMQEHP